MKHAFLLLLTLTLPTIAYAQTGTEGDPIVNYLWVWIRWICYTLGGLAGTSGVIFFLFGFWVSQPAAMKRGAISALAGFAFVLVIPMVRLIFSDWVADMEEEPFIPEATAMLWRVCHGLLA